MAEITIKIFDTDKGGVDLDAVFDPEYNQDHKTTPAQNFAAVVLQFINVKAEEIKKYYEDLAKESGPKEDSEHETTKEEGSDKDSVD